MKISLIDLDLVKNKRHRAFPNLALMKLSAWHRKRGDEISLNFPLKESDVTYASCVFSWHKPEEYSPIIKYGGSGLGNYGIVLPPEIEHIMPDYTLYPNMEFSMGYTSRGCIRDCRFCKVRRKEGYIQAWAEIGEFYSPKFQLLLLLDNNTLASPNWKNTLMDLINLKVLTDFNQGLDIRCLDDEKVYYLKQVKVKKYRFAFDNIAYEKKVRAGIDLILKAGIGRRKLSFYVLVGFDRDDEAIERMKLLQSYGVDVYPMIYKDDTGKEPKVAYEYDETIKFHGARGNLVKFLRVAGRLR